MADVTKKISDADVSIGSMVRLKSGSPRMTIEMWREDGLICTQWFDGKTHVRDCFDPVCLRLA